jgi:hypothetical protein
VRIAASSVPLVLSAIQVQLVLLAHSTPTPNLQARLTLAQFALRTLRPLVLAKPLSQIAKIAEWGEPVERESRVLSARQASRVLLRAVVLLVQSATTASREERVLHAHSVDMLTRQVAHHARHVSQEPVQLR